MKPKCIRRIIASVWTLVLIGNGALGGDDKVGDKNTSRNGLAAPTNASRQPITLAELLAMTPEQVENLDVALINLLCATGLRGSEGLDVQGCLDRLDAWAAHVDSETKRNFHHFTEQPGEYHKSLAYYRMGMLGTILAQDLQIQYDPEHEKQQRDGLLASGSVAQWNKFFGNSKDVFIHGLLYGKHYGTCSSMPFLYVAIGRRLGYPVNLAARKHHLYARYEEENGGHLNVEATENEGFATPSDEEYMGGVPPMTKEEVEGCGWMRPLSNREILGICLLIRSSCLRSMNQHNEEITTLKAAARYLPDSPLMKTVIEKNLALAANLHAEERWDQLWNELESMQLPSSGPKGEYFQNRRFAAQLSMNQSTNLSEIEKTVQQLKDDLAVFVKEISDDPAKMAASFRAASPAPGERRFFELLQDSPQPRPIFIPQEEIPREYWTNVPVDLIVRLEKLHTQHEMIQETDLYYREELRLRRVEAMNAADWPTGPAGPPPMQPGDAKFRLSQVGIDPADLPPVYRNMDIPTQVQRELIRRIQSVPGMVDHRSIATELLGRYKADQDQLRDVIESMQARRRPLDLQPLMQPPWEFIIVPAPGIPLTNAPGPITNSGVNTKGNP